MAHFISPGVYPTEIDRSNFIQRISSTVGGIVIAANRGKRGLNFITGKEQFISEYFDAGMPPKNLGYSWACALDFLDQGNQLWVYNVGDGSNYGMNALVIATSAGNPPSFLSVASALDPTDYDWATNPTHQLVIYGSSEGSWTKDYSLSISEVFGTIVDISIMDPGRKYTVAPTLTIVPGAGNTPTLAATATCTIDSKGRINSVTITESGAGYTKRPTVTVTPHANDMTSGNLKPGITPAVIGVQAKIKIPGFNINVWKNPGTYVTDGVTTTLTSYTLMETFRCTLNPNEVYNDKSWFVEDVVNTRSKYIRVIANPLHVNETVTRNVPLFAMSAGSGSTYPSNSDICTGYEAFRNAEELNVNILINGGWTHSSVHRKMISVCDPSYSSTARGDCFAVLDAPSAKQDLAVALTGYRTGDDDQVDVLNASSSYAAIYTPDYRRVDEFNKKEFWCPPSGAVAASMAYTDFVRDPWFAPAGISRGKITKGSKVRINYSPGERELLYSKEINFLRDLKSNGIVIWGNKTLQGYASATSSVSVRRMLLVLEKSLANFLLFFTFEPNDPFTRVQVVSICSSFLAEIQRARGIYAFKVVCDTTNNTPEVVDNNEMNVDVYIQPTRTAEVIHLRTTIMRTGASVEEYISTNSLN